MRSSSAKAASIARRATRSEAWRAVIVTRAPSAEDLRLAERSPGVGPDGPAGSDGSAEVVGIRPSAPAAPRALRRKRRRSIGCDVTHPPPGRTGRDWGSARPPAKGEGPRPRFLQTKYQRLNSPSATRGCEPPHDFAPRPSAMMIPQAGPALAALIFICISPAADAGDAAGRVTTVAVPSLGRPVAARADAGGTIHLLCDSPDGPRYARSTDGGATFSAAIPVVTRDVRPSGLEYSAWDMAVGKGGRVHVAMATNAWKPKLPEEEWGFSYPGFPR